MFRKKVKPGYLPAKPYGAIATLHAKERVSSIAAVQAYIKPTLFESVIKTPVVGPEQEDSSAEEIDPV